MDNYIDLRIMAEDR